MNKNKAFLLALPAIGAAFLAVLSQLSFSIGPIPITLQTFAVGLIATIFKTREAVLSVLLYLLLGAIGLPVFAGGSGGFQALFGPSAGYLWAYLLFALVTSSLTSKVLHNLFGQPARRCTGFYRWRNRTSFSG